jgi:K+-sensing histidine kinase KdpD
VNKGEILTMETTKDETSRLEAASAGTLRKVTEIAPSQNASEELLSVLLHDLRSPLGAVGVLADLLASYTEDGKVPEPRQIHLLQEAVNKAQRVLDDAVEIQALLRGHSLVTPVVTEISTIVRNSLEKASHAPYFRHVQVDYDSTHEEQTVRVDFEKAETAVLCALEQVASPLDAPSHIRVYYSLKRPFLNLNIVNEQSAVADSPMFDRRSGASMRGRLGTRKLGESRYNLDLCSRVMGLMGGRLEFSAGEFGRIIVLQLPMGH